MGRTRRSFSNELKAKIAPAALKGDKTMAELSSEFGVHAHMITRWKNEAKSTKTKKHPGTVFFVTSLFTD